MRLVEVFKGSVTEEMYLYVDQKEGVERVPEDLLKRFGTLASVMVIPLTEARTLARANAREVLASIESQGFYLQMPPPAEALVEAQIAAMIEADEQLRGGQDEEPQGHGQA